MTTFTTLSAEHALDMCSSKERVVILFALRDDLIAYEKRWTRLHTLFGVDVVHVDPSVDNVKLLQIPPLYPTIMFFENGSERERVVGFENVLSIERGM